MWPKHLKKIPTNGTMMKIIANETGIKKNQIAAKLNISPNKLKQLLSKRRASEFDKNETILQLCEMIKCECDEIPLIMIVRGKSNFAFLYELFIEIAENADMYAETGYPSGLTDDEENHYITYSLIYLLQEAGFDFNLVENSKKTREQVESASDDEDWLATNEVAITLKQILRNYVNLNGFYNAFIFREINEHDELFAEHFELEYMIRELAMCGLKDTETANKFDDFAAFYEDKTINAKSRMKRIVKGLQNSGRPATENIIKITYLSPEELGQLAETKSFGCTNTAHPDYYINRLILENIEIKKALALCLQKLNLDPQELERTLRVSEDDIKDF